MILPDGNILVAFNWTTHIHHLRATEFFERNGKVATCPITELNLIRVLMQFGLPARDADKTLQNFVAQFRSHLIPCDISAMKISGLCDGHRQTTDVYLAMLAKKQRLKIATLDEPFAKRFPSIVELVD